MKLLNKLCITIIFTLVVLILIKSNSEFKLEFFNKIYDTNISFSYFNKIYDKYIKKEETTEPVFSEKLNYISKEKYLDGVKLTFKEPTLIPLEETGVVIYKSYDTIIVQRIDGVDEVYANIGNSSVKLYDYIKKGTIIGEVNRDLYIAYKKDGIYLNYEDFIK